MARITYVKKAQQRYATVPVIDPETGEQKRTPVLRKDGTQKTTKAGKPVFLRVTKADKTRPLPNLRCEKCGTEIEPGQPYKHISPKSGPYGGRQRNRCAACPNWRPSETTSSNIRSIIYAAQESFEDRINEADSIDAIKDLLTEVAEQWKEAAEAARESATNIEDGFGHSTYQSDELNERADAIESAADELESWEPDEDNDDLDSLRDEVEDEAKDEILAEHPEYEDWDAFAASEDFDQDAVDNAIEDKAQERLSEILDAARDSASEAVSNIEE